MEHVRASAVHRFWFSASSASAPRRQRPQRDLCPSSTSSPASSAGIAGKTAALRPYHSRPRFTRPLVLEIRMWVAAAFEPARARSAAMSSSTSSGVPSVLDSNTAHARRSGSRRARIARPREVPSCPHLESRGHGSPEAIDGRDAVIYCLWATITNSAIATCATLRLSRQPT